MFRLHEQQYAIFHRLLIATLGLAIGLAANAYAAEVYKWTDAEGRVHFGDKPPDSGAEEIKIRSQSQPADPHVDGRRQRQQKLLQSYDEERQAQSKVQAQEDKKRQERDAKCQHAKRELKRMRQSSYLYETEKNGERRIFSYEERAKAEKQWLDAVKYWCN